VSLLGLGALVSDLEELDGRGKLVNDEFLPHP
jgi:hypothetical protein